MNRSGTNPWHLVEDFPIGINFCVWILQKDGLAVSPFDQHPAGDGSLQAAGLDARLWFLWFIEAVIGQRAPANPSLARIGTPVLQQRLQDLWGQYLPWANKWHRASTKRLVENFSQPEEHLRLWESLLPFQQSLPEMRIYYVDYPCVVSFVVPPVSAVLGFNEGATSAEISRYILQAAKKLSEARG